MTVTYKSPDHRIRCVCGNLSPCTGRADPKTCNHKRMVYGMCSTGEETRCCHACGYSPKVKP